MERLPGFRDFYPEPLPHPDLWSADARQHIFEHWRSTAKCYGFREYDGPPLETLELYTTKSGEEIVGQLYNFSDKGGRDVSLRPEMTPTLARMVAAHERGDFRAAERGRRQKQVLMPDAVDQAVRLAEGCRRTVGAERLTGC